MSSAPIVPGAAPSVPGATPSTFGSPDESTQNLLKIISATLQKPQLAQPVPAPLPPQSQAPQRGVAPGAQMSHSAAMGATIGSAIQNAWGQHKAQQLAKAEADWTQLIAAMQSGNKQSLDFILQDPKKLKSMAKALNQDWLNPEKTDVYGEALKAALAKHDQKQQAASGLKQLFGHLISRAQQPQLSPEQKQQMEKEILGRAPVTSDSASLKEVTPLIGDIMRGEQEDKRLAQQAQLQQQREEYDAHKQDLTQQYGQQRDASRQAFSQHLNDLREAHQDKMQADRDMMMLKTLGMRLSAEDQKKLQITPANINTEINSTLTSMRQQLTQAAAKAKELRTADTQWTKSHPWVSKLGMSSGVSGDAISSAETDVKSYQAAINYIEKNRTAILSGKADMGQVVDQAQQIMMGQADLSDLGGTKASAQR